MNAKHSAILLSGLLLLMIAAAWAQTSDKIQPTCPGTPNANGDARSSAWVRADWNSNTNRWDVDCTSLSISSNTVANAVRNATNALPPRRGGSRGNSNYVNMTPYVAPPDTNVYTGANANAAVRPANKVKSVKREPNTRRPGN